MSICKNLNLRLETPTSYLCLLLYISNTASKFLWDCFANDAAWEIARGRHPTRFTRASALLAESGDALVSIPASCRRCLAASLRSGARRSSIWCFCPATVVRASATVAVRVVKSMFPFPFLRGKCSRRKLTPAVWTLSKTRSHLLFTSDSSSQRRADVSRESYALLRMFTIWVINKMEHLCETLVQLFDSRTRYPKDAGIQLLVVVCVYCNASWVLPTIGIVWLVKYYILQDICLNE